MARYQINDVALKASGSSLSALSGAQVAIELADSDTDATLYAGATGGGTVSNPLTADASGRWSCWVDDGADYDVTVSAGGIQVPVTVRVRAAALPASGAGLPSTIVTKTGAYTASPGELVQADASGGGFTVTLPSNPDHGVLVAVKKVDSTLNFVTIDAAGSGTIDGQATAATQTQWAGAVLEHIGSDVWIIAAAMAVTGPASSVPGPAGPQGPVASALTITQQAGTTYTLVLADAGTEIETMNASAVALTVPPNSSVAFPIGTIINVRQYGAGQVTLTPGSGVTLRIPNGAKTAKQYATVALVKRGTNEWIVGGDSTT